MHASVYHRPGRQVHECDALRTRVRLACQKIVFATAWVLDAAEHILALHAIHKLANVRGRVHSAPVSATSYALV